MMKTEEKSYLNIFKETRQKYLNERKYIRK